MPLTGLLSFLRRYFLYRECGVICVNALNRASFISTKNKEDKYYGKESVSMPLTGLLSFLHEEKYC